METLFFGVLARYPIFLNILDGKKERLLISIVFSKIM
jgi:hypothetical protein